MPANYFISHFEIDFVTKKRIVLLIAISGKTKFQTADRVFVIDDEEAFCVMLSRMLSKFGYKVTTYNLASSAPFDEMTELDIIFIDMKMPEMNGLDVLNILASSHIQSSIILMSGARMETLTAAEKFAKQKNLNLIGVLDKPFRESDVRMLLQLS